MISCLVLVDLPTLSLYPCSSVNHLLVSQIILKRINMIFETYTLFHLRAIDLSVSLTIVLWCMTFVVKRLLSFLRFTPL